MILVGDDGSRIELGPDTSDSVGLLVPSPGPKGSKGDKGDKGVGISTITVSGDNLVFDMSEGADIVRAVPALSKATAEANRAGTQADRAQAVADGIQDIANDAAQVATDRIAVAEDRTAVEADRQTTTGARDTAVSAKTAAEAARDDTHDTKTSVDNTKSLIDSALDAYGMQFTANKNAAEQAVVNATVQADRAESEADRAERAADDITSGAVADGAVTTVKIQDGAVTKGKTSAEVQTLLNKANTSVQEGDSRLTDVRTPKGTTRAVWNAGTADAANLGLTPAELKEAVVTHIGATTPSTHTHTEAQVTGLTAKLSGLQALSEKGQANGYAPLDESGKLAAAFQPSYVDDVLEYANLAAFPAVGESGKIYTSLANNRIYRWSGSVYIEIAPSPGSTDVVPEGATNKYFTDARAQAALAAALALLAPKANPVFTGPVKGVPYPIGYVAALGTRAVGYLELPGGLTIPDGCTITKIAYSFDTADASGSTTVELRKNGAAIAGTSLAVSAANQASGSGTLTARTISGLTVSLAEGDVLAVYVSGVGATPGKGLTANIKAVTS